MGLTGILFSQTREQSSVPEQNARCKRHSRAAPVSPPTLPGIQSGVLLNGRWEAGVDKRQKGWREEMGVGLGQHRV